MSHKQLAFWIVITGVIGLFLPWTSPAQAQEATTENDTNCVACHEHRYYVYDSGKYFCLCDAPMHCIYCHGGRNDSSVKEIAHEDLVLYPTRNHAERCQSCHTEDYMSRVVSFETKAGVSSTPQSIITATPFEPVPTATEGSPALWLRLHRMEPWRWVGLGILVIALVGLVFFAYRCWRADCLPKIKPLT